MAQYIITGSYTAEAMRGMIAQPSDREKATSGLVRAAGGKLESFFLTTGDHDFIMRVTTDDVTRMLAALIVAGASGGVCNLRTVQCFTAKEFIAAQKQAAEIAAAYQAPN